MQEITQPELTINQLADIAILEIHEAMKIDVMGTPFRGHSFAAMYEKIISNIDEVRKDGMFATVDYREVYSGSKGPRMAATMHLAYYRAMMYYNMLHDDRFTPIQADIDAFYSMHLSWHYRLRDKMDAKEGAKLTHRWLN